MAGNSRESKSLTLEPLPRSIDGKSIFYRVFVTSTAFTGSNNSERVFVDGITKQTAVYTSRSDYLELLNAHISPLKKQDTRVEKVSNNLVNDNAQNALEKLLEEIKNLVGNNNQTNSEMKNFIEEQRRIINAQNELLKEFMKQKELPPETN